MTSSLACKVLQLWKAEATGIGKTWLCQVLAPLCHGLSIHVTQEVSCICLEPHWFWWCSVQGWGFICGDWITGWWPQVENLPCQAYCCKALWMFLILWILLCWGSISGYGKCSQYFPMACSAWKILQSEALTLQSDPHRQILTPVWSSTEVNRTGWEVKYYSVWIKE